jgi:hypothetical protein
MLEAAKAAQNVYRAAGVALLSQAGSVESQREMPPTSLPQKQNWSPL